MGEHIPVIVNPDLVSILILLVVGQYRTVSGQDPPPMHPVCKTVQPGIVGVVNHLRALKPEKIAYIDRQP